MRVRCAGLLALAALPAAAARAQDRAAAVAVRRLLGCYALEPGPWSRDTVLAGRHAVPSAGARFELTATPALPMGGPPTPGLLRVEGSMDALSGWRPPAKRGDSVIVGRPGAFAGVHLVLGAVEGGDLTGRIETFTDEPIPAPAPRWVSRPIRARRVACVAAVPGPAPARVLRNETLQITGLPGAAAAPASIPTCVHRGAWTTRTRTSAQGSD